MKLATILSILGVPAVACDLDGSYADATRTTTGAEVYLQNNLARARYAAVQCIFSMGDGLAIQVIWTYAPGDAPDSDLILAALTHDLAESVVGDLPPSGKSMLANAATAERLIATQNGWHVPTDHAARLTFADKLDAYMWAMHHRAPDNGEWADAREWLIWSAERMGIRDKLEGVL